MEDEYVIINKTQVEQELKDLIKAKDSIPNKHTFIKGLLLGGIDQLKEVLSQSTPLPPETKKYNELINILNQLEKDSTELPYINNIIKQALKNEKN